MLLRSLPHLPVGLCRALCPAFFLAGSGGDVFSAQTSFNPRSSLRFLCIDQRAVAIQGICQNRHLRRLPDHIPLPIGGKEITALTTCPDATVSLNPVGPSPTIGAPVEDDPINIQHQHKIGHQTCLPLLATLP